MSPRIPLSTRSADRTRALSSFALAAVLLIGLAAVRAEDRDNCLYCHQFPGLSRLDPNDQRIRLFYVDPAYTHAQRGPHARLSCTDCHERSEVAVVPHLPVTPVNCTRECHLVSPTAPERRFSHDNIGRMLEMSVHSPDSLRKLEFTGGPLLKPGQSMCLYCHDEPVFSDASPLVPGPAHASDRLFDRCDVCHLTQVPLDTRYFLRHVSSRLAPARPTLEMAQVCAVCHSDPKVLADRQMPDAVASYVRSFHGKAALLGDHSTAGCVSCHVRAGENAHLMLGPGDPRSSVHPDHVADSCRSTVCHPGADKSLANTAVHLDLPTARGTIDFTLAALFILLTLVSFGPSSVIVLLELAQLVVNRHHHAKAYIHTVLDRILQHRDGRRRLQRFTRLQRVQHWTLSFLFTLLVLTGFPLKFADQAWSAAIINGFGGLHAARTVHHWAGVALIVGFSLHLAHILAGVIRRSRERSAEGRALGLWGAFNRLPVAITPEDGRRGLQLVAYLLGLRKDRPMFGRFTVTEKFEYFGVMWGTTVLGVTGILLWLVEYSSHWVTGRVFNLATIIHTYEAFLALIHVGILHIYNVILAPTVFPLSRATVTGDTPEHKLADEHGEFVLQVARDLSIPLEADNRE